MENLQWTAFFAAVGNLGFPIVITSYLLIRFERKIENLNNNIQELAQVIRDNVRR